MKKLIVCVSTLLIVAISFNSVSADATNNNPEELRVESYISGLYSLIDFSHCNKLAFNVFAKAMHGYLNLRDAGKLNNDKHIISICNFDMPSTEQRLWIIDLVAKKVLFNTYVAHGRGSGDECANSFSNKANSHKSSLGFYVTGDTYEGEHGTSLHLFGMDEGYNDAAYDRGIVVHGAKYVSSRFIDEKDMLGRSWGCPAVPMELSLPIVNTIKDSTCLFIYYPESGYMRNGYWLNHRLASIPEQDLMDEAMKAEKVKPRVRVIEYIHNGHVDSTRTVSLPQ